MTYRLWATQAVLHATGRTTTRRALTTDAASRPTHSAPWKPPKLQSRLHVAASAFPMTLTLPSYAEPIGVAFIGFIPIDMSVLMPKPLNVPQLRFVRPKTITTC